MTVRELLFTRATVTWLILLTLTLAAPIFSIESGGTAAAAVVLGLATIKIRLVALDFMELRHAPPPMRAGVEVFCVVLWAALTGIYIWL
ncbi:cytochrome C oxidase subunit IV family protein [Nocardia sp. XZ_19_231]|uniref:cytochrome C oxidase subunit IV family protein n=1 Tax=Nocardia sp. XZ_19_231 TaxID=2769252 RepID=UPI0018907FB9|nr:cytochrome C oxidase subunit IV family protein [Nocardia sp. XZ_19_231]